MEILPFRQGLHTIQISISVPSGHIYSSTLAIDSLLRTSFQMRDHMSGLIHGVTTFAGTGCWSLRKTVGILRGRDCSRQVILEVEAVLSWGVIDQRVLTADVDADVGLISCVTRGVGQIARLHHLQRRSTRVCSDSSQQHWSLCRCRWCRAGWWEVGNVQKKSVEHGVRMSDFGASAQRHHVSVLIHTHVWTCENVFTIAHNWHNEDWQDWEKCACDEVFCLPLPSLTRESLFPVSENFQKKTHSHSLTIRDLAIGDRAIGDLAIDCLAIGVNVLESLEVRAATYFVRMMKRTRFVRNRFSSFGSTILILLAVLR